MEMNSLSWQPGACPVWRCC